MAVHPLECEQRTHVGLLRKTNEDYLECFAGRGLFMLADGMGGHRAGEVAARIAVEASARALLPVQQHDTADDLESLLTIGQAVETANLSVYRAMQDEAKLAGMGTTLVLAMFRLGRVYHAHVGDSRLYRLRNDRLECLTHDHSLVQELLDKGVYPDRAAAHAAGIGDNILTRGIGLGPEVEVDVGDAELAPGDLYLACSDGLCGRVADQTIARSMRSGQDLARIADELLQAALGAGGRDNISLILARTQP